MDQITNTLQSELRQTLDRLRQLGGAVVFEDYPGALEAGDDGEVGGDSVNASEERELSFSGAASDDHAGHDPFATWNTTRAPLWLTVPDQLDAFATLFAAPVGLIATVKVPSSSIWRSTVPSSS